LGKYIILKHINISINIWISYTFETLLSKFRKNNHI
jgi:hypothetical protein